MYVLVVTETCVIICVLAKGQRALWRMDGWHRLFQPWRLRLCPMGCFGKDFDESEVLASKNLNEIVSKTSKWDTEQSTRDSEYV